MKITHTYGWTTTPSFSDSGALLEEIKLLLMDQTLTDIPQGLKAAVIIMILLTRTALEAIR